MGASLNGVDELATNIEAGVDGGFALEDGRIESVVEDVGHSG